MSHQANDELRENQHDEAPLMYHVYMHPEGISLNGREFLLDDAGNVMLFPSIDNALKFVSDALRQVDELDADADDLTQDQMEKDYGYYVELDSWKDLAVVEIEQLEAQQPTFWSKWGERVQWRAVGVAAGVLTYASVSD